ncbi:Periplasmic binding protein/LacI transcriptional regulator [uncultured Eubacteriales bacterium]|uniref:Periplasmic binding protein/LacI transcriptional regulator n=1 Tax=uncultured Eubacteriales bacterium TaxID=172733 RepID=A0A212JUZ5_9FIRM|nr:Periplasmic binding protein/LacI transcriptional regulator [uncultured Eubacteriales bacterium]
MKKLVALTLSMVMALTFLSACGGTPAATPSPSGGAATPTQSGGKTYKVGLVILSGDHGFTGESVRHAEMEAAALMEKYDNLDIVVKSCGEAADQITEIENLIAAGDIDAIMLWPTEGEALRSAAQTVVDAGVKLVIYDRLIENFNGLEGQMMGDNFSIGHEMGVYLNDYYKDDEKVEYLRFVGDSSTVTSQRSGGMDEVLDARFEQVNETFVTDWSTEKAQEQMENWLNAHTNEEVEALDLIVTHDDEIVDGLMNALDAYSGTAKLNIRLITSVGGREDTMRKFENSKLDVKFITWFFAPSFIRECVDFTAEVAMGKPFSGTAVEENGIYLIPSFSISNTGDAHYSFEDYRTSSEYQVRYSIGDF